MPVGWNHQRIVTGKPKGQIVQTCDPVRVGRRPSEVIATRITAVTV